MPRVAIILPVLNGCELTYECLSYLREHTSPYLYKLVIINDGSSDNTSLITVHDDVDTVLHRTRNYGFGPSCNDGIMISRDTEYIVILNNDIVVPPHWLDICLEELDKNLYVTYHNQKAKFGMICPIAVEPLGKGPQLLHMTFSEYKEKYFNYNIGLLHSSLYFDLKGGPWIFRREVFNEVGLFDEQFVPGNWEENDLFLRMAQHGWVFAATDRCYSYHYSSITMDREFNNRELVEVNREKFIKKWGSDTITSADMFKEIE